MTSFSERMGITKKKTIQIADLDIDLRNSLWNVCRRYFFTKTRDHLAADHMHSIARLMYIFYFKLPVDSLPRVTDSFVKNVLGHFQLAQWFDVLNIVEFLRTKCLYEIIKQQQFESDINRVLEIEKSAYRFIAGKLASITNEIEMQELEQATKHIDRFGPVSEHVRTALELYSQKPQPDYRNSIKESISAVESAAKIVTGLANATLGAAINEIDKKHSLHKAFKSGIIQLYGYTSDEGGIRHGLSEAANIDEADARYMLVSCSAFANYLISRYDKQP
ncbi:AbiJ-NTD4 domain-containing protein [Methylocapsa aurea]|uniref:AbiJ-NTD4 domain-containing protein n=1 Tax=Methylocapsa aurea TaxID=663610 RepID=UPI00056B7011|nr:hypothetical protein [Methylocapsa aurea]